VSTRPVEAPPPELGNLEANLNFLNGAGLLQPGAVILEIGSGRGGLLNALLGQGLDAIGVDTSQARINEARAHRGDLPIRLTSGITLPFEDASFDFVLSFDVLEHIPDTDGHLAEVRRVLKPGGWYLLQTPNKWTNSVFETIRWRSFTRWREDHCALHSYGELSQRLAGAGFDPIFVDVPVVTAFFRQKVRRHLGAVGAALVAVVGPDRLPRQLRTNFYVKARKR
jgi:SAM-dependent methyltransferase